MLEENVLVEKAIPKMGKETNRWTMSVGLLVKPSLLRLLTEDEYDQENDKHERVQRIHSRTRIPVNTSVSNEFLLCQDKLRTSNS